MYLFTLHWIHVNGGGVMDMHSHLQLQATIRCCWVTIDKITGHYREITGHYRRRVEVVPAICVEKIHHK